MQKQKFEDSLKDVFNGAEQDPSSSVWTNIDLELERIEGGKMKRRVLFYQLVAAASILFAVTAGGLLYYSSTQTDTSGVVAVQSVAPDEQKSDESPRDSEKQSQALADNQSSQAKQSIENNGDRQPLAQAMEQSEASTSKNENHTGTDRLNKLNRSADRNADVAAGTPRNRLANENVSQAETTKKNGGQRSTINSNDYAIANDASVILPKRNQRSNDDLPNNGTNTAGVANTANASRGELSGGEDATALFLPTSLLAERAGHALPKLYTSKPVLLQLPDYTPDPGELLLAQLADEEKRLNEDDKKKEQRDERLWTSLGFAAGSYTNAAKTAPAIEPVNGFASIAKNDNSNLANRSIANETNASGTTYSIGLNVGGKVAKRWIVQGGVNYLTQSSSYTSNALLLNNKEVVPTSLTTLNKVGDASFRSSNIIGTSDYSVNNSMQFFSVPVMAGYLIIDRSFGWQLNTGVSTDLFLQNEVSSESSNLSNTVNGRGADSPYRPYNFSGLVGTEFSYRVANRYRVALNPGIRYPFNSIYKSETGINATPVTFDVALKFRYIFQ